MTSNISSYIKIFILSAVFFFCSCGQRKVSDEGVLMTRQFSQPDPPAMLQDPGEIAEWLALRFWDQAAQLPEGYLCDSTHVNGIPKGDMEQAMANFIYVLDMLPIETARKASSVLAERMADSERNDTTSNFMEMMASIGERYMYDPNSPLRNEDYFQPIAAMLSSSEFVSESSRDRFSYISKRSSLNRIGTRAADFRFCDKAGKVRTLHGIRTEYTLLFFSNPGCQSCLDIINNLKSSEKVTEMISDGRLSVLNIYIDEDLQGWREYMPVYPKEWYNGFDPDLVLRNNDIYNIRAIPSLYLLDSDKTVMMKDAVPERLFEIIQKL